MGVPWRCKKNVLLKPPHGSDGDMQLHAEVGDEGWAGNFGLQCDVFFYGGVGFLLRISSTDFVQETIHSETAISILVSNFETVIPTCLCRYLQKKS